MFICGSNFYIFNASQGTNDENHFRILTLIFLWLGLSLVQAESRQKKPAVTQLNQLVSDVMQRIAAPMIGGMITAPLLSLFVIPVIYLIWKRRGLEISTSTTDIKID